jgi:hypothetical protein
MLLERLILSRRGVLLRKLLADGRRGGLENLLNESPIFTYSYINELV